LQLFTAENAKFAERTMMKHFREKKKSIILCDLSVLGG
jgi:hypothetical protein